MNADGRYELNQSSDPEIAELQIKKSRIILELLVLVDDLHSILISCPVAVVANRGEMAVRRHNRQRSSVAP